MKQAKNTIMIGTILIAAGIVLAIATSFESTTLIIGIILVVIGFFMTKSGKERARQRLELLLGGSLIGHMKVLTTTIEESPELFQEAMATINTIGIPRL